MGYYNRRRYKSWRSRGSGRSSAPSKFTVLSALFGSAIERIRYAFMNLDEDALDELFSDYGAIHGDSAERYARKTFPNWKNGKTNLSGQTMERLVELVPPYLSSEQRFSILQLVLKRHKRSAPSRTIRINVKQPEEGFSELQNALASMSHNDFLAHLPENVMKAGSWLYDDDITAARAMLAEAERLENDMIRTTASREIALLRRTISSGQVQAANYSVEMPAGSLNVIAFTPSKCFVATVCFGEAAPETVALRFWRDHYLVETNWGRKFIVWYYKNGEKIATIVSRSTLLKGLARVCIGIFSKIVAPKFNRSIE
ncbi:hypothetical protein CLU93_4566 [Janthinobacterium sp. 35]|nr:hypothetical protein CLU93_4566 [Janthinobacterium sp. 35]